jgi:esterase/lipase
MSQNFLNDARGAIEYVRDQGAGEIILVGASLGGLASAKLAIESGASGLVVFASPAEIPQWDFQIESADLDTDIPKLFLTAENDHVVPLADSQTLYDLAAEPKEWQTYSGTSHGTDLFDKEHGAEAQQRILNFILAVAAQNP